MKHLLTMAAVMAVATAAPAMANDHDMSEKIEHWFMKLDADKNGSISKEEHDAFGEKMFTEADTNKDNIISKDELTAHKMKEKAEWKAKKDAE